MALASLCALLTFTLSCAEPTSTTDGLSPADPAGSLSDTLAIQPQQAQALPGQQVVFTAPSQTVGGTRVDGHTTWSTSGGTIDTNGVFMAAVSGTYTVTGEKGGKKGRGKVNVGNGGSALAEVAVSPATLGLPPGGAYTFSASGTQSDGSTVPVAVTWSATGGTVDTTGRYVAGSTAGTYRIVGVQKGGSLADTSVVTIASAPAPTVSLVAVELTPGAVSLAGGASQQFSAVGRMSDGSSSSVALTWTATGGTISTSGAYTAGQAAGSYRVIASSGGFADTSAVTVTVRTLTALSLTPASVSLASGASQQFAVAATWSDGTTTLPTVSWSGTGGTVSGSGWYTAGSSAGTYRVIAAGGGRADTSVVQVLAAPSVTAVTLSPASVSLQVGGTQQFSATATFSDGSTSPASVSYSATGGTVSGQGLYTAGQSAGTFALIASCSCGRADTSSVQVVAPAPPPPSGGGVPSLGMNASLNGWRPFPADNPWNTPIDTAPVDPNSAAIIATMKGADYAIGPDWGFPPYNNQQWGIPYIVVSGAQAKVPIVFTAYGYESDPGPYPVPGNAPIEGTASSDLDRHVLVLDRDNQVLYELNGAFPQSDGSWQARSGAIFDLKTNALRPIGWTSADAAGLPIFPGLIRIDEVLAGEIRHALRFTVLNTRKAFVAPATHHASWITDPTYPPMGMRVRLKASFDISGFSPQTQVILRALKKYGMFVADNGANWAIQGTTDAQGRWDERILDEFKQIKGSNFEVVKMGTIITQ